MRLGKVFTVVVLLGLLGGCAATSALPGQSFSGSSSPSASPLPSFETVSSAQFAKAKAAFSVEVDEFNGHSEVYVHPDTSMFFKDESGRAMVVVGITRHDDKSKWNFNLMTVYGGQEWLFHDTLDLKTENGVFNLTIDDLSRDDQVGNGGSVSEIAGTNLNDSQIESFCNVISGRKPKGRLSGTSGGVKEVVGFLPNAGDLRNGCTIWYGVQNGMKLGS